jgi:DNA polymerase III psi subunit
MNMSTNSAFLKEMGITEWTARDADESGGFLVISLKVMQRYFFRTSFGPLA